MGRYKRIDGDDHLYCARCKEYKRLKRHQHGLCRRCRAEGWGATTDEDGSFVEWIRTLENPEDSGA